MTIEPIAYFHSPMKSKFGIPRQSGLAESLPGRIVFEPPYRQADALRGIKDFDYLWLIWEFSANRPTPPHLTVRPPRLGGNERVGVFASRSPYRPNRLGLSCVRLDRVETDTDEGPVIHVLGADLMDGTPIYDVKPYVAYADSHPEARCGFVDEHEWQPLEVVVPPEMENEFSTEELEALRQVLAQDPRPRYQNDENRVYGFLYGEHNILFQILRNRVVLRPKIVNKS